MKINHYVLADHICRKCHGGRILSWTNSGPTGGGNPVWICADCGASTSGFDPRGICWCGDGLKNQKSGHYMCLPYEEARNNEQIFNLFLSCGCNPKQFDYFGVGIVPTEKMNEYERE